MGVVNASKKKMAPCQEACPAGIDVPRYVRAYPRGPLRRSPGRHPGEDPLPLRLRVRLRAPLRGEVLAQPVRRPRGDPHAQAHRGGKRLEKAAPACPHEPHGQEGRRHRLGTGGTHGGILPHPAGARRDRLRGPGRGGRHAALRHSRLPAARRDRGSGHQGHRRDGREDPHEEEDRFRRGPPGEGL